MTTASSFKTSMKLYDCLLDGEYKRKTFGPHGSLDIFDVNFSGEHILKKLEQIVEERKLKELNQDVSNLTISSRKKEIPKRQGYKPEEISLPRAKENNYDPDADPNFEFVNEEEWEHEQQYAEYVKQRKNDEIEQRRKDGKMFYYVESSSSMRPSARIIDLPEEEEDQYSSDEFVAPPPKVEPKSHRPKKNKDWIKEMQAKRAGRR